MLANKYQDTINTPSVKFDKVKICVGIKLINKWQNKTINDKKQTTALRQSEGVSVGS